MGYLAVSRSLGDVELVPYISQVPTVYKSKIHRYDKFIVMGCDGLFDVLSDQEVVDMVNSCSGNPSIFLREQAYLFGSGDNISVIVIKLDFVE